MAEQPSKKRVGSYRDLNLPESTPPELSQLAKNLYEMALESGITDEVATEAAVATIASMMGGYSGQGITAVEAKVAKQYFRQKVVEFTRKRQLVGEGPAPQGNPGS